MHPGDVVAGKYRVQSILSRSRGLLLEAQHTDIDQRVVIRILSPQMCNEKEVERFRREARTLSKLDSEHVARIIDVGTHTDGSFFLVREYLEGEDLATHLKNHGGLPLQDACLYLIQAMEAVQEAHSHNIVLREMQPSALFLTEVAGQPTVKVIDFGTVKVLKEPGDDGGEGMAATVIFGMSPYWSPELVRKSADLDHRTDVWSLGCILYELLAATLPFQGDMAELMLKITRDDPIPLSQLRPDLPPEFDQIINWALAKEPSSRYESVYAFAHALREYAPAESHSIIDRIGVLAHTDNTANEVPAAAVSAPSHDSGGEIDLGSTAYIGDMVLPDLGDLSGSRKSATSLVEDERTSEAPKKTGGVKWAIAAAAVGIVGLLVVLLVVKPFSTAEGGDGKFGGAIDVRSGMAFEDDDDRATPPRAQAEEETTTGTPVWGGTTQTGTKAAAGDGKASSGDGGGKPSTPATTSDPKPLATAPPASGGTGKIVGIAIGGTCTFAVDGANKGTSSSIRIDVPVGSHTVSCQPPGGSVRSKTVMVTADKPGIASFRL